MTTLLGILQEGRLSYRLLSVIHDKTLTFSRQFTHQNMTISLYRQTQLLERRYSNLPEQDSTLIRLALIIFVMFS